MSADTDTHRSGGAGPSARDVLHDPLVRRYIVVQVTTSVAVALHVAILAKQLWDITGKELSLGLLGLVEFAPSAFLVLVTGSVADRFDRRKVAALGMAGQCVAMAVLAMYARGNPTQAWPLYAMALVYGTARAFVSPATRSMPPMVAPDGALPRTVALSSAMFTVAFVVGPAASGFLYAIDPSVGYTVALVLMLAGLVGVLRLQFRRQPTRSTERPTMHSAFEGLRFIRATPLLLAAIALDLFAVLFGGAVALLPAIADERLGVGDVGYGWLRAAVGIGMGVSAAFIAVRPVQRHVGKVLLVVVGVFGAATVLLGITRSYAFAFLALMVLSGADMVSMFIRSTLVPLITPDDKRGRVFAVEMLFIGASNELGAFESGVAAAALGTATAVVIGGVATMAIVGIWWVLFPTLRDVDRFSDLDHAAA